MAAVQALRSFADLVRAGETRLRAAGIDTARLDAELLVAAAAGLDRAQLYTRMQGAASAAASDAAEELLERRARREPLAYLTGVQEFWSLPFRVTPAVLIPRPETELLVERCLRLLADRGGGYPIRLCDLGTGSGCIAVALARELASARLVATDASADALAVAAANAARHGVEERITFRHDDLFAACAADGPFDIVVCNPPYLAPGDARSPELAFEPQAALAGGADGLAIVRRVVLDAAPHVLPSGWLLMEIGGAQAVAVEALARAAGWADVNVEPDLAGLPRVLSARRAR